MGAVSTALSEVSENRRKNAYIQQFRIAGEIATFNSEVPETGNAHATASNFSHSDQVFSAGSIMANPPIPG
jgi:hypothetical protein